MGGIIRSESAEIFFQFFLWEDIVSSSSMSWNVHSDVVHLALPLLTTVSPNFQGALKGGFGEAVTVRHMPEPCEFQY